MPDGSMSIRREARDRSSIAATSMFSEEAKDAVFRAFDRTSLHALFIHTAACELYGNAMNAQKADAADDMHLTMIIDWAKEIHETLEKELNVYHLIGHEAQHSNASAIGPANLGGIAQRVIDAVSPLLVENKVMDFAFASDRSEIDVYRALRPICDDFTVADAVKCSDILHAARQGLVETQPIQYGALYEAGHILEAFIASARPSSLECVAALSRYLAIFEVDGEQRMVECNRPIAAVTLNAGIAALTSHDFSTGERFASAGDRIDPEGWCYRVAKTSERLNYWYGASDDSPAPEVLSETAQALHLEQERRDAAD